MKTTAVARHRARALRKALSPPELRLWLRLRKRVDGVPVFRRQDPIGPFIADFYCPAARLVIEIDSAHHDSEAAAVHDARKDAYLRCLGVRVERISAASVLADADAVAHSLVLLALSLAPAPRGR